ncbi:UDP-N-acetylglucosamine 2-epimerase (hydrolyzing) [Polaribacter pectinis]|uniref:UDP-N-acetylglucosamine 2-epimerase (Hydrolyzing) n=1 Tax=Polaribacter pectinis TaxID=2738844 RepID=A0A7G9LCB5_9FLAO|nr:UDP-N-acetylglucosamine 2-epimerase [Polaribacter pectinis]QNM86264.1 UDP-N-acetylglucosamine 2-epimerase (hydrolyzing) [Polaribacter pectinis]
MKKLVFLTGTRADFGKLKSLIKITQESSNFDVQIFATGMHLDEKYGLTVNEIYKSGFNNVATYKNHAGAEFMDRTLAKTILGFSEYISKQKPDLIVVHGDRVEALAGAIVGSLNNILVAHIEGGEISGTIDELIRHSVSKLAHLHLVSNDEAKKRIIQMGELESSVYVIGSPDLDLMNPNNLPDIDKVKEYYSIYFNEYAIAMYHPVTTEYENIKDQVAIFVDSLLASNKNYVVIFPNNDLGTEEILEEYKRLENNSKFIIFPSLRFENFLRLLQNANFIIGNSSAGIREAPFYKVPTIDIGSRQNNRSKGSSILNVAHKSSEILTAIENSVALKSEKIDISEFGEGNSNTVFLHLLNSEEIWNVNCQKQFQDL